MKKRAETESAIGRAFAGHAAREALQREGCVGLGRKADQYENPLTDMVNLFIAHAKARRSIEWAKAKRGEN